MKKYNQFLNENRLFRFTFSISLENSKYNDRENLITELEKFMRINYIDILYDDRIVGVALEFFILPDSKIHNCQIIASLNKSSFKVVNTYTYNKISIDDFLKVGMNGVLEYFEIKNNSSKYNL